MVKIGGNIDCVLKIEDVKTRAIGEKVKGWVDLQTIHGFLDLMNNGKDFATYNKAMEDSTHVFVCDYVSITDKNGKKVRATKLKATINGNDYDVTYIDDPMELHQHLEIFLKRVGDQVLAGRSDVTFTDNSVKVKADLNEALVAFLIEASAEVKTQAERYTPTGSSQLKRSWDTTVDAGKLEAIVGNTQEYAIYQEFGTGEYALEGKGRKGYWVYVKDSDNGSVARSTKQYTLAQAKRIMAMLRKKGLEAYYTNGTRPKRMLYKAFQLTKPKIEERAKQIFKSRGFQIVEEELLAVFKDALDKLSIESAYMVYAGDTYPYMTYEYYETGVTHEDGGTSGELLCEIWSRGTFAELIDIKNKLKEFFKQKNIMVGNNVYHFDYASSVPDDTGDAELKKRQVSITTRYWKGA